MDNREKLKQAVLAKIDQLDDVEVAALSDEDLEDVSGGEACSIWCCSGGSAEFK